MMSILMLVVLVFQGSVGAFQGRLAICLGAVDSMGDHAEAVSGSCSSSCCGHEHHENHDHHEDHMHDGCDASDDGAVSGCSHERGVSLLFGIHADDGSGCNCSDVVIVLKGEDATVRSSEMELVSDVLPLHVGASLNGSVSGFPSDIAWNVPRIRDDDPGGVAPCALLRTTRLLI